MNKLLWYLLVFFRECYRGKWRAIWAFFVDSTYRQDAEQLRHDIGFAGVTTSGLVPFGRLVHGHKVHYWDWVEILIDHILAGRKIDEENPLEVVKFTENGQVYYRVIDGQHRFMAMRLSGRYRSKDLVHVKVYWKTK